MGKFLRKLFLLLFAIVFVGSGYLLLRQFHDYTVAQNAYDQAKEASSRASALSASAAAEQRRSNSSTSRREVPLYSRHSVRSGE